MDLATTLRLGRTERDMVDAALEGLPVEKQKYKGQTLNGRKDITKPTGKSFLEALSLHLHFQCNCLRFRQ